MFIDAVSQLKEGSQFDILRSLDDPSVIKIAMKGTFLSNIDSSINTKKRYACVHLCMRASERASE